MTRERGRWISVCWLAVCLVGSSIWCLTAARRLGATFDEPVYLAAGLDRWRHGGVGGLMRLGVMPLPVDVVTLPVWLYERRGAEPLRLATDGRGHVTDDRDVHRALPIARAANLVFWWLLVIAIWILARRLGGDAAAAIAIAFLVVEPSLLAHAALATTDIAVTAALLAFAVAWIADTRAEPRRARGWILPGVWFGVALLCKASALTFAPLIVLASAVTRERGVEWNSIARRGAKVTAVGLLIAFVYCGSDWQREDSFVEWAQSLAPGPAASALQFTAEHLTLFSNAGEGLVQQIKHNIRGHDTFLLGQAYSRAVWFYFPVVLSIKLSAGLLAALVAACFWRRRQVMNTAVVAAACILLCTPAFRVQTGVRMVLPLVALAVVGVSVALASVTSARGRRLAAVAALVCVSWSALDAWRSWPDGLRFANQLWGGTENAYRLVSDSNYDWGQGLPDLAEQAGHSAPLLIWYWGTDPEARSTQWSLLDPRAIADTDEPSLRRLLEGRVLAVSTTALFGSVLVDGTRVSEMDRQALMVAEALRRLLNATPSRSRTRTFLIYDFRSGVGAGAPLPSLR